MADPNQKIEKTEITKSEEFAPAAEKPQLPEKEGRIEDIYENVAQDEGKSESKGLGAEKAGIVSATNAQSQYQQRQKQIEAFLEKGLAEEFMKMSLPEQKEFKRVGEETATRINELLDSGKVKVKKIIDLIKRWLSLLPGVNKFFIEQEAKIKADEIVKLREGE